MSFLEHSTLTTLRARPLVPATIARKNALQITPMARMPGWLRQRVCRRAIRYVSL